MTPLILVANAGSSSLKFALFRKNEADRPVAEAAGQVEGIGTQPRFTVRNAAGQTLVDRAHDVDDVPHHGGAIAVIRSWLHEHDQGAKLLAVGHRVVHGGQRFSEPVLVDPKVVTELEALVPLAPLHQPQCIAVIRAQICRQAAWLGLELDAAANERHGPCLSTPASKVTAWLLPTDEDLIIARHTLEWVTRSPESGGLAQG